MTNRNLNRRTFAMAAGGLAIHQSIRPLTSWAGPSPLAPQQEPKSTGIQVELPRGRVPLSFIIDDSTCLVNMGKFCMPQFAATYPQRADYQKPWQDWPDEIPDSFVREFGEWCAEHGVKGKYSIVPYPACVGWLDRVLPGWSQQQLRESIQLVQNLMLPNWDIHPEMITHTRVIDLKTGRPFQDYSPARMENSYPQQDVSVDYLASYLAYALRILKNCDLPCEGITTPGGFGSRVKDKLPYAVLEAVRDVYSVDLPHYFKYIAEGDEDPHPRVEAFQARDGGTPDLVMNVLAGTGDWFGGWDGAEQSRGSLYSNEDATSGRMVELIEKRQPAIMLCHWPGMYCGGSKEGFHDFQEVVIALEKRFANQTLWMKVSEIARYWAAKELTRISATNNAVQLAAPFACPAFTLSLPGRFSKVIVAKSGRRESHQSDTVEKIALRSVQSLTALQPGCFFQSEDRCISCFDMPAGRTDLELQ